MSHLVFDLSEDSYPFSAACAVVQIEKAAFFIVVYRPPPSLKFCFSNHILMESISIYFNNFKTFCLKRGLNSNFELYVVGDFNMPKVAWACLSSYSSSDNVLLDFFMDLGVNQIINEATHIRGNCLDLIFTSLESISFNLPKEPFSDPFPIIFQVPLINSYRSIRISTYSKSSFSIQAFNQELFSLNELLTFQIKASDLFSLWYYELKKAFSVSIAKKQRKRVSAPFFYSSQTMHLLNKSETIKRRLEKDWTLSYSLKMRKVRKSFQSQLNLTRVFSLRNVI